MKDAIPKIPFLFKAIIILKVVNYNILINTSTKC
jgi:hypothetical protein